MEVLIASADIRRRVCELGSQIASDYPDSTPLLVGVLNGCICFVSDLMQAIPIPHELDFVSVTSYGAASESSRNPRLVKDLEKRIAGRDVILVEDIVDSGHTLHFLRESLLKGDIVETMSCLGACFFGNRKRFEELEWLDEAHGRWGQVGTEAACKSFLSGGRLMVNKRTWFSHMFRTQGGDFSFPYEISGNEQERSRKYSQDLWLNNKWKKQVHPLEWLIEKFKPVPDWH